MELGPYFFDTYALIEISLGTPAYKKYVKGASIVTSTLNLMEMYYSMRRENPREEVELFYEYLRPFAADIDDYLVKEAMEFRLANRRRRLSYVDCIGYVFARRNGIKFLTGDMAFERLPGVEYVK
ncbi:MAG: PIN domain-containing protein [Candidatus Altiarchaeota archaeon]|nr:PIN domain-containing protein [Candidatus Altiarchaeota archaeon]